MAVNKCHPAVPTQDLLNCKYRQLIQMFKTLCGSILCDPNGYFIGLVRGLWPISFPQPGRPKRVAPSKSEGLGMAARAACQIPHFAVQTMCPEAPLAPTAPPCDSPRGTIWETSLPSTDSAPWQGPTDWLIESFSPHSSLNWLHFLQFTNVPVIHSSLDVVLPSISGHSNQVDETIK